MYEINDKIVVITGGLGGIGIEFIKSFLKEAVAGVAILDLPCPENKNPLAPFNKEHHNKIKFIPTDVTDSAQIKNALEKTITAFSRIDILINCAGIADLHDWKRCTHINLIGSIDVTLTAMDNYMKEGIIIDVASISALMPFSYAPIYANTKHRQLGFLTSKALIVEEKKQNYKLIVICPGLTKTPLIMNPATEDAEIKEFIKKNVQEPSYVASSLMKIIPMATNGSIWVIENYKTYEVEIPHRTDMQKEIKSN